MTSARLAVDLMPVQGLHEPTLCLAASDELERSYRALAEFEEALHAPLVDLAGILPWRAAARRRSGTIDVLREVHRLALIWAEAARRCDRDLSFDWGLGIPTVRGDRRHLVEAVTNLLSNAVRHGSGQIGVVVVARGHTVRIEISDEGPGLPLPVAQLARKRRRLGPHGHGLAVAVRAVAKLGGSISSAPSAGGSLVIVEIPGRSHVRAVRADQATVSDRAAEVEGDGESNVRVLDPLSRTDGAR